MLEGRLEGMLCGKCCFAVYGKEEFISKLIDHLKNSTAVSYDVRFIGGLDVMGRTKIAITGKIIESMSLEDFRTVLISCYAPSA